MWEIHDEKGLNSPVASFVGGTPLEVSNRYRLASPIELLPLNVNQILIHGELDRHVPVELSIEYCRKTIQQGDKVRLIVLPETDHFMIMDPSSSAWKTVSDALKNVIGV
jgi:dipeptidyl aminopeptidase/acylaminoacyl peptidase